MKIKIDGHYIEGDADDIKKALEIIFRSDRKGPMSPQFPQPDLCPPWYTQPQWSADGYYSGDVPSHMSGHSIC